MLCLFIKSVHERSNVWEALAACGYGGPLVVEPSEGGGADTELRHTHSSLWSREFIKKSPRRLLCDSSSYVCLTNQAGVRRDLATLIQFSKKKKKKENPKEDHWFMRSVISLVTQCCCCKTFVSFIHHSAGIDHLNSCGVQWLALLPHTKTWFILLCRRHREPFKLLRRSTASVSSRCFTAGIDVGFFHWTASWKSPALPPRV